MAMRIKKYVADTMPEALKLVKAELGPQAVILNTRTVRKSGALGLRGKGQVEVTAAVDKDRSGRKQPSGKPTRPQARKAPAARKPPPAPRASGAQETTEQTLPSDGSGWADRISRQIEALHAALQSTSNARPQEGNLVLPGALEPLSLQMQEAGLDSALAQDLLKAILLDPGENGLKDLKPLQDRAIQMLAGRFCPPLHTRLAKGVRAVVALVGPAGSGKTTAAARIAAHFASAQNARAAFVAADTDRVGGLEQLRAYAGILGIPVDVVQTPEEMGDVIRTRRDIDLVLIDTAGTSPIASDQIASLGALLREAGPSEIHLVLGASTGLQQMRDTANAYADVGVDRLFLTKLDETGRLGAACTLAAESGLPLSYTTHGRSVPGDLNPADPGALACAFFTRRPHGASK